MDFPDTTCGVSSTVGLVYGLVNNTKVLVLYELMDYTLKGGLGLSL